MEFSFPETKVAAEPNHGEETEVVQSVDSSNDVAEREDSSSPCLPPMNLDSSENENRSNSRSALENRDEEDGEDLDQEETEKDMTESMLKRKRDESTDFSSSSESLCSDEVDALLEEGGTFNL